MCVDTVAHALHTHLVELALRRKDDGELQVLLRVRVDLGQRELRAGQHHGLAQVFEHVRLCGAG